MIAEGSAIIKAAFRYRIRANSFVNQGPFFTCNAKNCHSGSYYDGKNYCRAVYFISIDSNGMPELRPTPLSWANVSGSSSVEIKKRNAALPRAFEGGSERPPALARSLPFPHVRHVRPPLWPPFLFSFGSENANVASRLRRAR